MKTLKLNDLKENRSEIISVISELVGSFNVKEVMAEMVKELEFDYTEMESLINMSIYNLGLTPSRRKASRNAEILGKLAEMED